LHHLADMLDLVQVDGVAHVWVDAFGDLAAKGLEDGGGFVDAFDWDVEVNVAAAQEDGGTF
jgi:hypothetical protein